jgi:hypothetical protein
MRAENWRTLRAFPQPARPVLRFGVGIQPVPGQRVQQLAGERQFIFELERRAEPGACDVLDHR